MISKNDPIKKVLKSITFAISLTVCIIGGFVAIASTSMYSFTPTEALGSEIGCYRNMTVIAVNRTRFFSFDHILIILQPLVIGFLAFAIGSVSGNTKNMCVGFVCVMICIFCATFFAVKSIYYTIAASNCPSFWFCKYPCFSKKTISGVSYPFIISILADYVCFLVSILAVFVVPAVGFSNIKLNPRLDSEIMISMKYKPKYEVDTHDDDDILGIHTHND